MASDAIPVPLGKNSKSPPTMTRSSSMRCSVDAIVVHDLIGAAPSRDAIAEVDAVLIGGSGDYSVVEGGAWLPAALEAMRDLHDRSIPTFASCWGFQAMAMALGGEVVTDMERAELGTCTLELTEAGRRDPVTGPLGTPFQAQLGHQDIVDSIPDDAVLLASSERVTNEAFCFPDRLIYCTQFHPELSRDQLLDRLRTYPKYVREITGLDIEAFARSCVDTPGASALLGRWAGLLRSRA